MPKINLERLQLIPLDHFSEADDFGKLIDGVTGTADNLNYEPLNSTSDIAFPHRILIDLWSEYTLEKFRFFDGSGSPTIQFYAGSTPFDLIQYGGDIVMNSFNVWRENTSVSGLTNIKYVMFVLVTPVSRFPSEIEVWGTRTGSAFVEPNADATNYPLIWDMVGTCGHPGGHDPVKLGQSFSIARMYYNLPYTQKLVNGVLKSRFDNSYAGGLNNAKFQAFKDNNVKINLDAQFSPNSVLNKNNFLSDFSGVTSTTSMGNSFSAITGTWGVINNKGYCVSALNSGSSITNIVIGTNDQDANVYTYQLEIALGNFFSSVYSIFRYSDPNNYLFVNVKGDNTLSLNKKVSGITTQIGATVSNAGVTGNTFMLRIDNNYSNVDLYVNSSYKGFFGDSHNQSAYKVGFGVISGSGTTGNLDRFDVATHHDDYKPIRWNADATNPNSYLDIAKVDYINIGYYGNGNVSISDLNLDLVPEFGHTQPSVANLDLIYSYEVWNEQNKFWQKSYGWYQPYVYAAMLSARYDGHEGTIGQKAGIKIADPNMVVVMAGMIKIDITYVQAMHYWFKNYRGDQRFAADVINFHHYCNDGEGQFTGTIGIMPEGANNNLLTKLQAIVDYRNKYLKGIEIWLSEIGYDTNQSIQRSPAIGSWDQEEVQGIWLIRTELIIAKSGIEKYMNFTFTDEPGVTTGSTGQYIKSGIVTSENTGQLPKKSWWFVKEFNDVFKTTDFKFISDESEINYNKFVFKNSSDDKLVFCWSPTQSGITISSQTITPPLGNTWESAKMITFNGLTSRTETTIPNNSSIITHINENPIGFFYRKSRRRIKKSHKVSWF